MSEQPTIDGALRDFLRRKDGVVTLPAARHKAHRSTVELIKEMAEEADLGQVTEIVMVGMRPDGTFVVLASPSMSVLRTLGALEQAKHDVLNSRDEE